MCFPFVFYVSKWLRETMGKVSGCSALDDFGTFSFISLHILEDNLNKAFSTVNMEGELGGGGGVASK